MVKFQQMIRLDVSRICKALLHHTLWWLFNGVFESKLEVFNTLYVIFNSHSIALNQDTWRHWIHTTFRITIEHCIYIMPIVYTKGLLTTKNCKKIYIRTNNISRDFIQSSVKMWLKEIMMMSNQRKENSNNWKKLK